VGQGVYEGRSVMAKSKEEKAAYFRAYYIANKDKLSAKNKKWYINNKEKALAYGKAWNESNKEYIKECREVNKEKVAEKQKLYREANKDKIAAQNKAYREANKDKCRETYKKWAANNKERLREYSKTYSSLGKRKEYQQKNKHIYQNNSAKYRALKRKQIPIHLRDCSHEKQRMLQIYKLSNIISVATGVQHHVDHMWPLNDGGPHWSGNLQVIPAYDNLSKNASVCEDTKNTVIKSLYTFESERNI
jgi:hypothetical protein